MNLKAVFPIVLILAVAAVVGLIAISADGEVSWDDLDTMDNYASERARSISSGDTVTIEDIANFVLYGCGLTDTVFGTTEFDRRSMIEHSGILHGVGKELSETAKMRDLNRMMSNSRDLKEAYGAGTPYFSHGLAQPVFEYTSMSNPDYTNEDSTILRYCVYVETEYDTDDDGMRDLVKVFLQVPRQAVEGKYKAPVILECNPYGVGLVSAEEAIDLPPSDSYDLSKLRSQPAPRVPVSSVGTMELAMSSGPSDWSSKTSSYSSAKKYDYYLVRGYAVAICCGLGTYGSEGFVCTGTDIELSSYRNVVEWFDGKSRAFSDREGCIEAFADWSNGNVGAIGTSYVGTIPIGLAAMGIDNLKAVVPVGAICNWYEYVVHQGAYINYPNPYIGYLSGYCSSRYLDTGMPQEYKDYLAKVKYDEALLQGNYTDGTSDFWSSRDYRNLGPVPGTTVLLVEGLNEDNVKTKHTDLAYRMFSDSGFDVRMILHLGLHQSLDGGSLTIDGEKRATTQPVGDEYYTELINELMSNRLFGIDNGASDRPRISVQSNLDGSWSFYDDIPETSTMTFVSDSDDLNSISRSYYDAHEQVFRETSDPGRSTILFDVDDRIDIFGVCKVTITAATSEVVPDATMTVALYDVYDGLMSYVNILPSKTSNDVRYLGEDMWVGGGIKPYRVTDYYQTACTYELISSAQVDMNNPSSDYESSTAVFETISEDTFYTYTMYLDPAVYSIEAGHTLALSVYTQDPNNVDYQNIPGCDYVLTIDEGSIMVELSTL